jgi:ABC-2 type transport system permease protein
MAIMFLMFTAAGGGRALLQERDSGTLDRLLATPTSSAQVLGGKVLGTFATGLVQQSLLLGATSLIFGRGWGPFPFVALVVLALVAAATAWGTLISALARSTAQAYQLGVVLTLVFAMISGNFFNRSALPVILQRLSYITPNAWGLEAFAKLVAGASFGVLAPGILALAAMAIALFAVAVFAFRRQYA